MNAISNGGNLLLHCIAASSSYQCGTKADDGTRADGCRSRVLVHRDTALAIRNAHIGTVKRDNKVLRACSSGASCRLTDASEKATQFGLKLAQHHGAGSLELAAAASKGTTVLGVRTVLTCSIRQGSAACDEQKRGENKLHGDE